MSILSSSLKDVGFPYSSLNNISFPSSTVFLKKLFNLEKSDCVWKNVAIVAIAGVSVHFAVKSYKKWSENNRRGKYKKGVVILHQMDRCTTLPTISSYALKLETYLRIAEIPYENDFQEPFGPKGKCPWITYNGVDVADSDFCIEFLNNKFGIDLNEGFEASQLAIARCLTITAEYNFAFCGGMWRFGFDKDLLVFKVLPNFPWKIAKYFPCLLRRQLRTVCYYHGIGRHSEKEVYQIGIADLKAFSDFLGNKTYFLGDKVSVVDCAMFGILAQCVWGLPNSPFENAVHGELQNLLHFCGRMKEEYWPDWNDNLYKE